jgi:GTP 3',8-cyclase
MLDPFNREINYLRISVTDRCNLRCVYCMPQDGVKLIPHQEILSFEEITHIAQVAVTLGIKKIRITGGEPLVRKGIVTLVSMIAQISALEDFSMTTNGVLLSEYADKLSIAGLGRVNISLDTLNPEKYWAITRGGNIRHVLDGIDAALAAELSPIKLNCVVETSPEEPDAQQVAQFASSKGLQIQFIRKMDIASGHFWPVHGGSGGRCNMCNRLRLSSDGFIRPCLFSDIAFQIRGQDAYEVLKKAIEAKPHSGVRSQHNTFYCVGG